MRLKTREMGNSLVGQWLGLCAFTAKDPGSIPGWSNHPNGTVPQNQNKQAKREIVFYIYPSLPVPLFFLCSFFLLKNLGFPGGTVAKSSAASARDMRDMGSVPGLGRSARGGNGSPLQYSCLGNPMDRGAWRLQSVESRRVRHDWAWTHIWRTSLAFLLDESPGEESSCLSCIWKCLCFTFIFESYFHWI